MEGPTVEVMVSIFEANSWKKMQHPLAMKSPLVGCHLFLAFPYLEPSSLALLLMLEADDWTVSWLVCY